MEVSNSRSRKGPVTHHRFKAARTAAQLAPDDLRLEGESASAARSTRPHAADPLFQLLFRMAIGLRRSACRLAQIVKWPQLVRNPDKVRATALRMVSAIGDHGGDRYGRTFAHSRISAAMSLIVADNRPWPTTPHHRGSPAEPEDFVADMGCMPSMANTTWPGDATGTQTLGLAVANAGVRS